MKIIISLYDTSAIRAYIIGLGPLFDAVSMENMFATKLGYLRIGIVIVHANRTAGIVSINKSTESSPSELLCNFISLSFIYDSLQRQRVDSTANSAYKTELARSNQNHNHVQ